MRFVQPKGSKGSLKWIQVAVERFPQTLQHMSTPPITWVSPTADDDYAEYRDGAFLERLGLTALLPSLREFWPQGGPQWDALGLTSAGPILVEAKAHVREFFSPASQASSRSLAQIERAFAMVQSDLGLKPSVSWANSYFQYANRLAYLWWLRNNGVDAKLLFVSFLNDDEMRGPKHAETWEAAFASADYALGLPQRHRLRPHVLHIMPDVNEFLRCR